MDHIVELHPSDKWEVAIAVGSLLEAVHALRGVSGLSVFGLPAGAVDPDRAEQMIVMLVDALRAWQDWCLVHKPGYASIAESALARATRL